MGITGTVALRKESVDRNKGFAARHGLKTVALRKESVDRNLLPAPLAPSRRESLSARRAWIEIVIVQLIQSRSAPSLSARRAWIEIMRGIMLLTAVVGRSPQGERG